MLLENKIALITGAGQGIGKAIAFALAGEGAFTVLLDRNKDALERVRSEIEGMGGKAALSLCDLREETQIYSAVEKVLKEYGRIDILINNAAISVEMPFLKMPQEVFDEQFSVDFRAPMLLLRLVLPSMMENKSGTVVNISAAAGERGGAGACAYASAKAALTNLTKSVGEEVKGGGVRINCVCPGPVDTEMFQKSSIREYEMKHGGDITSPEAVANTVLYLASDMSRGMSCQAVTVRGANRW